MAGHTRTLGYKAAMLVAAAFLAAPVAAPARDEVHRPAIPSGEGAPETPAACRAEAASFVMPTTGVPFTLPTNAGSTSALDCAVSAPPALVRPPAPSLFRMAALPVGNGGLNQKWERARLGSVTEHRGPWDELLAQANQVSSGNPIGMVNQWVNWHVRYRSDPADEWASASTTLRRGFGDCEDFALAKMALLLALGVPSDEMYLVLLRDRRLDQHAVLVVNRGGRHYVLDNRTDMVLTAEQIDDYTPILSFSGSFAWTYGKPLG